MGVFTGCQIVLDLTTTVRFKEKVSLRKSVTENGGIISYIVTKKSTHVVCNDPDKADVSYKCKMAVKYNVPVVSISFLEACVEKGALLNTDDFLLVGKSKSDDFKSGKITARQSQRRDKKKAMKPVYNVSGVRVWKPGEKNCPDYSSDYQLAKFAIFRGQVKEKNRRLTLFTVIEVHVLPDSAYDSNRPDAYKYRVFSHSGTLQDVERGYTGNIEMRFTHNVDEAIAVYSHLYREEQNPRRGMTIVHDVFSRHIGSDKFRKMMSELGMESGSVAPSVGDLVEYIWQEAAGELEAILSVPVSSIKAEQVEKAEAVLKQLKSSLENDDKAKQSKLKDEFYSCIPHKQRELTLTKAWLSRKQDTCQLVKDMVSVSEATDWSTRSGLAAKYKALRCRLEHVPSTSPEFKVTVDHIRQSMIGSDEVNIENVFAVHRPLEAENFRNDLDPKQLLFHSSRVENFVGILSRGLLLPKVVVDDFGGTRSDPGMLGSGIYFASAASTSVKYSTASNVRGTRLMLVNEVALGKCLDMYQSDLTLTSAPDGYNSVHGVRSTGGMPSEFKNDEYVVYSTEQQVIRYLVEFSIEGDNPVDLPELFDDAVLDIDTEENQDINLNDVQNITDPMSKVKAGLVCTGDETVDLIAVHVRARLVDMASEVVVLQEYYNNSLSVLEAKYVFPLGELAAVCGFEAFINGKHIVGEVKEKETAHKEYKKAISEGHGAYLMDQDKETPDVFTVSVGNLPPGATVLIKITYVEELQTEGELISFRLPGSVAPWQKNSALKDSTQHDTETVEVDQGDTSVEVAVEMPFDIRSIECSTNKVKIKQSSTKAVVEMLENQSIADGFQLLIGLAEIHVPRMWVEQQTDNQEHRACMLSFYPEFEACEEDEADIVFLLDLSNSMKGGNLVDAKKVLLLALQHLPHHWTFNVVVFGTAFKELFPASVVRTASNMKIAAEFVKGLKADMGNTEVIRPLHTLYLLGQESSQRNVFLISDGHINNSDLLLSKVGTSAHHTRIFCMGVSSTANRHLLRALARLGAGAYEFFDSKVKSKWEGKVKAQIHRASQPGLTAVSVHWEQHDENVPPPVQAPRQITALFNGSRQVVYGYVPNCTMATLKAQVAGYEVSTVVSTSELGITKGQILHRLTARAIIRDWEDGVLSPDRTDHEIVKMNTKNYIIELSKEYSIVTQFTSFVAIERRGEGEETADVVPSTSDLVTKESVDILPYISYKEDLLSEEEGLLSGRKLYDSIGSPIPDFEVDEDSDSDAWSSNIYMCAMEEGESEDSDSSDLEEEGHRGKKKRPPVHVPAVEALQAKLERIEEMALDINMEIQTQSAQLDSLAMLEERSEALVPDGKAVFAKGMEMRRRAIEDSESEESDDDMGYGLFDDEPSPMAEEMMESCLDSVDSAEEIYDDGGSFDSAVLETKAMTVTRNLELLGGTLFGSRATLAQQSMAYGTGRPPSPQLLEADLGVAPQTALAAGFGGSGSGFGSLAAPQPQQLPLAAPGGFTFGGPASSQPTESTAVFGGQVTTAQQSNAFGFGGPVRQQGGGGLFGVQQKAVTGAFGAPAHAGFSFGGRSDAGTSSGLFGAPAQAQAGFSFGGPLDSSKSSGLFGAPREAQAQQVSFGAPAQAQTGFSFGGPPNSSKSSGLFGAPREAQAQQVSFGAPAPTPAGFSFGGPSDNSKSSGLFEALAPSQAGFSFGGSSDSSKTSGLFGAPPDAEYQQVAFRAPAQAGFSFGGPSDPGTSDAAKLGGKMAKKKAVRESSPELQTKGTALFSASTWSVQREREEFVAYALVDETRYDERPILQSQMMGGAPVPPPFQAAASPPPASRPKPPQISAPPPPPPPPAMSAVAPPPALPARGMAPPARGKAPPLPPGGMAPPPALPARGMAPPSPARRSYIAPAKLGAAVPPPPPPPPPLPPPRNSGRLMDTRGPSPVSEKLVFGSLSPSPSLPPRLGIALNLAKPQVSSDDLMEALEARLCSRRGAAKMKPQVPLAKSFLKDKGGDEERKSLTKELKMRKKKQVKETEEEGEEEEEDRPIAVTCAVSWRAAPESADIPVRDSSKADMGFRYTEYSGRLMDTRGPSPVSEKLVFTSLSPSPSPPPRRHIAEALNRGEPQVSSDGSDRPDLMEALEARLCSRRGAAKMKPQVPLAKSFLKDKGGDEERKSLTKELKMRKKKQVKETEEEEERGPIAVTCAGSWRAAPESADIADRDSSKADMGFRYTERRAKAPRKIITKLIAREDELMHVPLMKDTCSLEMDIEEDISEAISAPVQLEDYGIGSTEKHSILKGPCRLDMDKINDILQGRQRKDGSWILNKELEGILGVDNGQCWTILKTAGIQSYGEKVCHDIKCLVGTLIVLLSIIKYLLQASLPLNFRDLQKKTDILAELITAVLKLHQAGTLKVESPVQKIHQAIDYCVQVNDRYPLVYSSLELGYSWEEVVARMLEIHDHGAQCGEE